MTFVSYSILLLSILLGFAIKVTYSQGTTCQSGYYLNKGQCTACTPALYCKTLTCTTTSNSVCTSCLSGYYLKQGVCTACSSAVGCKFFFSSCTSDSNFICGSCLTGYYLSQGACFPCASIPGCNNDLTCYPSTSSACLVCNVGYYLKFGTCQPCLPRSNCASVICGDSTSSLCTSCNFGYTLESGDCSSLSAGAVAGIVCGTFGLIGLVTIVTLFLLRRRKRNLSASYAGEKRSELQSSGCWQQDTFPMDHLQENLIQQSDTFISADPPFPTNTSQQVIPYPFTAKDILIERVIGDGSFGVVKLGKIHNSWVPTNCTDLIARHTNDNYFLCAVKTLKDTLDEKSKRDFAEECKTMVSFYHSNIIRVIAVLQDTRSPVLVTEFMKYGNLKEVLVKSESKSLFWHEREFLYVLQQIAQGMEYLQSIKFIHRDLAAGSCLVSDNLTVKISDFGLLKELAVGKNYYTLQAKGRFPMKWMAPESITFHRFTHASDMWSFGVTMWEIFSYGHTPYDHLPPTDVLAWLEKGERLECPQPCISIPIVYEWMLKCWEYEPATRPSFSESKEFLFTQVNSSTVSGQEIRNIGQLL